MNKLQNERHEQHVTTSYDSRIPSQLRALRGRRAIGLGSVLQGAGLDRMHASGWHTPSQGGCTHVVPGAGAMDVRALVAGELVD